jgi:hypothetical protein
MCCFDAIYIIICILYGLFYPLIPAIGSNAADIKQNQLLARIFRTKKRIVAKKSGGQCLFKLK